jgi:hypothetical protein
MDFSDTISYIWKEDRVVLFLLLIGWSIGEVLAQIVLDLMGGDTSFVYLIIGAVGALISGLAFRRIKSSYSWIHVFINMVAWMLLWEARWQVANLLHIQPGLNGGWYLIRLIAAAVAGVVTGIVLKNIEPAIDWKRIIRISVGWVIGWGLAPVIVGYFHTAPNRIVQWQTPITTFLYVWILALVLVGFSGGISTLREILNAEGTSSYFPD